MDFTRAAYACAAHYSHQWPPDAGAEVAFAGRSNVGKSSAINAIVNQKRLAHASKTPGRTRQIVFFDLDAAHRLVDLPGYGYAKAPQDLRRHWQGFIEEYLTRRACLKALVVPMDIRRPLTELDRAMLGCCREISLPAHILLTKADKFKRGQAANALLRARAEVESRDGVAQLATVQLFSAIKRDGVEEASEIIAAHLLR
ncbi:MAG: ribosome biogenesis GTP-binding protein YihA/YsxC [bacterium]